MISVTVEEYKVNPSSPNAPICSEVTERTSHHLLENLAEAALYDYSPLYT